MRTFTTRFALAQTRRALHPSSTGIINLNHARASLQRGVHTTSRHDRQHSSLTLSFAQSHLSSNHTRILALHPADTILRVHRSYTTSQSRPQQSQPKEHSQEPTKSASSETQSASAKAAGSAKASQAEDTTAGQHSAGSASSKSETKDKEQGESETNGKDGKEEDEGAPEPPHGDKTPWQVFRDTLSSEFKSSKEWNEGTKALSSGYDEVTQSEAIRKAKAAYEESMRATSSTAAAAARVVGKGASAVWESPVGKVARKGASAAAEGLDKATKPVRDTETYKSIASTIDDGSSSRYGGWMDKEERQRRRALREAAMKRDGAKFEKMEEDPDAGTNVTLHKDSAWKESWREFRQSSKLFQQFDGLKSTYEQSDNPLVSTARAWADTIGRFFAENETAMVIKKLREMDPGFQLEPFLIEMREYILPEVLDAYVKGDVATLKQWLSAAQYNVYAALMQQYTTQGLVSDGRILDIRNVDLLNARLLDPGDVPVFVITCRTQEVHVYRNKKSGELAAGVDDKVQQVTYAIGVTRIPEDVSNPETRGWRLIELQKSARDYY